MKRLLFLLGSGLLLASSAHAQWGVRAGGSLLSFSMADQLVGAASVTHSARLGYQVGATYKVALNKRFSLVPEVQFSREQQHVIVSSASLVDATAYSDYRLSLSYLNVPVVLQVAIGPVYLEAGPQVSLLVGGHGTGYTNGFSIAGGSYNRDIDQAATARYHRLDAGFCLGVGIKLPAGVGLSVRAYQGVKQLNPDYTYDPGTPIPYSGNKEYRQTLQASLTYQLHSS